MRYHLSVMSIRAVKVECSGPKPDWNLASKLFSSNKYLYVWLNCSLKTFGSYWKNRNGPVIIWTKPRVSLKDWGHSCTFPVTGDDPSKDNSVKDVSQGASYIWNWCLEAGIPSRSSAFPAGRSPTSMGTSSTFISPKSKRLLFQGLIKSVNWLEGCPPLKQDLGLYQ